MKKKGFTLIELIVVIAIIGVLAAILVPAMLGYVKKSKITTANTTAKSVYNAFNTALVDLDTQDVKISAFDSLFTGKQDGSNTTDFPTSATSMGSTPAKADLGSRVYNYFSDIAKVKDFAVTITNGACVGCGVMNGVYPGAYPTPMTVDEYSKNAASYTDSTKALTFATTGKLN